VDHPSPILGTVTELSLYLWTTTQLSPRLDAIDEDLFIVETIAEASSGRAVRSVSEGVSCASTEAGGDDTPSSELSTDIKECFAYIEQRLATKMKTKKVKKTATRAALSRIKVVMGTLTMRRSRNLCLPSRWLW
jgi:hypothetical protein